MTYNIIGRYKPDRLNFHNIITYQRNGTAYPLKKIHDALKSAGVRYDFLFIDRIQACRYLVKDFGTSESPKSTRQRDSRYAPT
ncbi:MAG: hypothetical protein KZQ65_08875, partial [Candidatus Thiodiazotropha sp. (ex Gloverina cf. vestifex)]|nr:hypothetical protein [Candidatus Thiodiazotropha sp. (ex Gloverina cf. vestifex)]